MELASNPKAECPQALGTKENNHTKYNNTIHAPYRKHMYMDCDYIELKKVLKENDTLKTTYGPWTRRWSVVHDMNTEDR